MIQAWFQDPHCPIVWGMNLGTDSKQGEFWSEVWDWFAAETHARTLCTFWMLPSRFSSDFNPYHIVHFYSGPIIHTGFGISGAVRTWICGKHRAAVLDQELAEMQTHSPFEKCICGYLLLCSSWGEERMLKVPVEMPLKPFEPRWASSPPAERGALQSRCTGHAGAC